MGQVLDEYLQNRAERLIDQPQPQELKPEPDNGRHLKMEPDNVPEKLAAQKLIRFGDLCPECGQAAVINEEGCRKCYACGYSEC